MKVKLLLVLSVAFAFAAIPDGYYDNAEGLSGTGLRSALHDIIDGHTVLSYTPGVWNAFQTTDLKPNGKIWDIYSTYEYTWGTDQNSGSTPGSEGVDYNREHSWPKTYFNDASPMVTDVFHIYPSDTYVNNRRSNYPYGEVASASFTSTNGSKLGSARSDLGYSGTVFEPADEYKGDLARTYFYMSTRYYNEDGGWSNWAMADGADLKQWAVDMLLEWSANDPVSEKEINRNDAIYALQHNRNPFIDHPEYVSYIWGGETPSVLAAPVAIAASDLDSTSFTANWNSVSNADGYKLYVAEDSIFSMSLSGYDPLTLTGLNENIAGLIPENDYYYKVKAYNSSEESDFSNVIRTRTLEGGGTVTPPDTGDTHIETFANFPETGSSYNNGSFAGEDGSTWTYDQCRGDVIINNETPCLGKGQSPTASITSGTISGGIVSLSFQYKQAYSSNVSLDVFVNDVKYATVTSNNETGVIKESGTIDINISDNVVIKFVQSSDEAGQVAIDNVTWNSMPVAVKPAVDNGFKLGDIYPNPFNPVCWQPFTLGKSTNVRISLLDILGRERKIIENGYMYAGDHIATIMSDGLPSGIYFVQFQTLDQISMKKVVLLK